MLIVFQPELYTIAFRSPVRWVISVSSQSAVPESYAVRGKTCYININPDGSYARVLTAPCRSLLLDQQSTPGSKYRFILK
ncbi:hypothetical protein ACV23_08540 [Salmonella enterica]|nr:hypothetical protein [Salmonella enterica]EAR3984061.1 hypothetical protein [Salmonella enterica]EAV4453502.1 hypothetical protein [Salmonella enterica]EAW6597622.1 hypothetical protein [Salmonella enterica]EAX1665556.1 hypothetical protein [Salmonella enterica]